MHKQRTAMLAGTSAGMQGNTAIGGFTLIELMITVAIVAILAAVAYPSYTAQIIRGQRTAGQNFVMDLAQREEQFFLDNRAYTGALANLGYAALPPEVVPYYAAPNFALVAGPPAGYTISIAPLAGSRLAQVADGTLYVNNLGQRWREVDGDGAYTAANDCTFEDGSCKPH